VNRIFIPGGSPVSRHVSNRLFEVAPGPWSRVPHLLQSQTPARPPPRQRRTSDRLQSPLWNRSPITYKISCARTDSTPLIPWNGLTQESCVKYADSLLNGLCFGAAASMGAPARVLRGVTPRRLTPSRPPIFCRHRRRRSIRYPSTDVTAAPRSRSSVLRRSGIGPLQPVLLISRTCGSWGTDRDVQDWSVRTTSASILNSRSIHSSVLSGRISNNDSTVGRSSGRALETRDSTRRGSGSRPAVASVCSASPRTASARDPIRRGRSNHDPIRPVEPGSRRRSAPPRSNLCVGVSPAIGPSLNAILLHPMIRPLFLPC